MSGAPGEEFTKEALRAGKIAKKIRQSIQNQKETMCIKDKTKVCDLCHECDVSILNPNY